MKKLILMTILSAFISQSAFAKDNCGLDQIKNFIVELNNYLKSEPSLMSKHTDTVKCENNTLIFNVIYNDQVSDDFEKNVDTDIMKFNNAKTGYINRTTLEYCLANYYVFFRQNNIGVYHKISTKNMKNIFEFGVSPQDCEPDNLKNIFEFGVLPQASEINKK